MVTIHIELNDTQALPVAIKAIERAIRSERGRQVFREKKSHRNYVALEFFNKDGNPHRMNLDVVKKYAEEEAAKAAQHSVNVEYLKRFCEELKKEAERFRNE